MLLDKSDIVLYLSHEVKELKYLERVFHEIWDLVCQLSVEEIEENGQNNYEDLVIKIKESLDEKFTED